MCVSFVKCCARCATNYERALQVSCNEVTPEIFINSSAWVLSLQTGTCRVLGLPQETAQLVVQNYYLHLQINISPLQGLLRHAAPQFAIS